MLPRLDYCNSILAGIPLHINRFTYLLTYLYYAFVYLAYFSSGCSRLGRLHRRSSKESLGIVGAGSQNTDRKIFPSPSKQCQSTEGIAGTWKLFASAAWKLPSHPSTMLTYRCSAWFYVWCQHYQSMQQPTEKLLTKMSRNQEFTSWLLIQTEVKLPGDLKESRHNVFKMKKTSLGNNLKLCQHQTKHSTEPSSQCCV